MFNNKNKKTKVYVGVSGGVDSSVSAALLKEKGFDVLGVFIKVWYPDFLDCDWKSEMRDAMRVCAKLDIPFKMVDLSKEYKKLVVDYMVNEYKNGKTPNPDVMCNKEVKFGAFYNWAIEDGADYIATGHYAQIKKDKLIMAADDKKDQTYFIWNLKKDQLKKVLFPIGKYKKDKVRKIAGKKDLFTAIKKDSQGLCFLGHINIKDFLSEFFEIKTGEVLNQEGKVIGKHQGSVTYTIGQRHGFDIFSKTPNDKPYYVVSKNLSDNTITVSNQDLIKESIKSINISNLNLNQEIKTNQNILNLKARIRYRQPLIDITLDLDSNIVHFKDRQNNVAIGQSVVFYKNKQCLGGAIISQIIV